MMFRIILVCSFFCFSITASAQVVLGGRRNINDIAIRDSLVAAVTNNSIELWDIKLKKLIKAIEQPGSDIFSSVSFGRSYTDIITGTRAGELTYWNMITGEKRVITSGNHGAVTTIDVNVPKELVAVGFSNKRVTLYSLANFNEVFSNESYSGEVTAVKFTRDNNALLSGSGDGKMMIYTVGNSQSTILHEKLNWVRGIAETYDSTKLAIASDNGRITFLKRSGNTAVVSEIQTLRVSRDWITSLDYYSGTDCLAYTTLSGKVFIKTKNGDYKRKMRSIVNQVKFIARRDNYLSLVLATSKGLILLNAVEMKFID